MTWRSWGRAGGWTAVIAALTLVGMLARSIDRWDTRIAVLERSTAWQQTVLYLLAQKAKIQVPPPPARNERPHPDTPEDGLFAADTNRTEGGCR